MDDNDSNSVQQALSEVVSFEDIVAMWRGFATKNEKESNLDDNSRKNQSKKSTLLPQKRAQPKSCGDIMQLVRQLNKLSTISSDSKESDESKSNLKSQLQEMNDIASQLQLMIIKKYKREICLNEEFIKKYSFYFLISLKLLQKINDKKKRGMLDVAVISGFNEMLVADKSFQSSDNEEKKEVFLLLIELAREAEINLDIPFKFDDGAILRGFDTIISDCLDKVDPTECFADNLKKSKNYFTPEFSKTSDFHLLIEFLHQKLIRIPIEHRFEYCKKYMYELEENKDLESGYDALRYFIDHDPEMQNQVNSELQLLKNPHNIEAIRRILSETS